MTFEISDSEQHLIAQSIGVALIHARENYARQEIIDEKVLANLLRPLKDLREKFKQEKSAGAGLKYRCSVCGTGPILVGQVCPKCGE